MLALSRCLGNHSLTCTVLELVLRGAGGNFLPMSWLLSTLCHEVRMPMPCYITSEAYIQVAPASSHQGESPRAHCSAAYLTSPGK